MTTIAPDHIVPYKAVKSSDGQERQCELKVWLPNDGAAAPVPIYYWVHGGGFIDGDASDCSDVHLKTVLEDLKCAFVSVNYRLAPQARLDAIVQDVAEAWSFAHTKLDAALGGNKLDTSKSILSGASAGGLLSLASIAHLSPKPKALFLLYPLTDFLHPTFTAKVPFPNKIKEEDVASYLAEDGPVLTGSRANVDFATMTPGGRTAACFYALQEGTMDRYILPRGDSLADWSIEKRVKSGSVPTPTVIVHGKDDLMVPYETATSLAENKLKALGGAEVELISLDAANHGWDLIPGADASPFKKAFQTIAAAL